LTRCSGVAAHRSCSASTVAPAAGPLTWVTGHVFTDFATAATQAAGGAAFPLTGDARFYPVGILDNELVEYSVNVGNLEIRKLSKLNLAPEGMGLGRRW